MSTGLRGSAAGESLKGDAETEDELAEVNRMDGGVTSRAGVPRSAGALGRRPLGPRERWDSCGLRGLWGT